MKHQLILLLGLGIFLNLDACGPKETVEPAPEKTCKLLYDGNSTTYEYDDNYRVTQTADGGVKYNYDQNGYLLEQVRSSGNKITYQYTNGLLSKETGSEGTTEYEYSSQNKLVKVIGKYGNFISTDTYNNGKIVSTIYNDNGIKTQPYQYENGKVIRYDYTNGSYSTYDYDSKERQIRYNNYNSSKQLTSYGVYVYQENGIPSGNVSPRNFFKGFPDEIKNIKPNGLLIKSTTYSIRNNSLVKGSESTFMYVLNAKGYPTSTTETYSYLTVTGVWTQDNPNKRTHAYFNCDE